MQIYKFFGILPISDPVLYWLGTIISGFVPFMFGFYFSPFDMALATSFNFPIFNLCNVGANKVVSGN